jgi:hypothetical protein
MTAIPRSGPRRATTREICAALAVVMAIASLPAVGVVVFRGAGAPCFTLNICHPLQSAYRSPDTVPLARPAIIASEVSMAEFAAPAAAADSMLSRFLPPPEPRPPELSA